jgi:hypothetical protein
MITLGDVRKAGKGWPDDTPIKLMIMNDPIGVEAVEFGRVDKEAIGIVIRGEVIMEDDDEEEDEETDLPIVDPETMADQCYAWAKDLSKIRQEAAMESHCDTKMITIINGIRGVANDIVRRIPEVEEEEENMEAYDPHDEQPTAVTLERYMQIAKDIKKEFVYTKSAGKWYWYDRGDEPLTQEDIGQTFPTFWECLCDAIAPYIEEEEENADSSTA